MDTSPGPDPTDGGTDAGNADGAGDGPVDPGGIGRATGPDPESDTEPDASKDPLRFNNWMKRSAAGAVMTGIARGFHQALEPPRKESAFVMRADDEPDDQDGPIELRFDPDDPAGTVAIIRRSATADAPDVVPD